MRASILAAGLALVSGIVADEPYYRNQSKPFNLVLSSHEKRLDGAFLTTCHEGAAIEALCVSRNGTVSASIFTFNYTDVNGPPANAETGYTGLVTWLLRGGNFEVSSSLNLAPTPDTNVAVPLFQPGDQGYANFAFDSKDRLLVPSYLDNTVSPPVFKTQLLRRWYVCLTRVGYFYQTLAWTVGSAEPENPSCRKVSVKRVFI